MEVNGQLQASASLVPGRFSGNYWVGDFVGIELICTL
jgi:hypothetical protein